MNRLAYILHISLDLIRRIRQDQTIHTCLRCLFHKTLRSIGVNYICVSHEHHRNLCIFPDFHTISNILSVVTPPDNARMFASWITGPSAVGSENGMPSSIKSAPASSSVMATTYRAHHAVRLRSRQSLWSSPFSLPEASGR